MELVVLEGSPQDTEEISRSVTLTNQEWAILALCAEAYAESHRAKHSQTIATLVTRKQLDEAVEQASRMNDLIQQLDKIQAKLM